MAGGKGMKDFYQKHWLDMPEFEQTEKKPYAKIIMRVETKEDLEELGKRLEQKFTPQTKSAWFPFRSHWGLEKKVWVSDES